MKQGYTHIAVVLDNSGSMQSIKKPTIEGFNTFLKAQKEAEGEATFTMVEFPVTDMGNIAAPFTFINGQAVDVITKNPAIDIKVDHDFASIAAVPPLNEETYLPQTMTPLLDTIGELIVRTGNSLKVIPEALRPSKVLFVIITDGYENASKKYNYQKIQEMIQHQKIVYNWEFIYLGANQDAIKEGGKMGIAASMSMSYNAQDAVAVGSTYGILASKTMAFRSSQADASVLDFNDEERKSAMGKK